MGRLLKGRGHWLVLAAIMAAFGGLVWGTFGRSHIKTVVRTQTVTQTVTRRVNTVWDGNPQSLVAFFKPTQAGPMKCAKGYPAGTKCYGYLGQTFLVTLAQASS